jgi:predicted helicase
MTKVYHAELFGTRESKYNWLNNHDISSTKWKKLNPRKEFYLFMHFNEKGFKQYQSYYKITDIFPVNSVGIVTARDSLTIHWSKEEAWATFRNFANLESELARKTYDLGKDSRDWKVINAQKDLMESGINKNKIVEILYRLFDRRYTYYTGNSSGIHCTPRNEVMQHINNKKNVALITSRLTKGESFRHIFVSDVIVEKILLSSKTSNNGFVFPLYIYQDKPGMKKSFHSQLMMFEPAAVYQAIKPNIKPELFEELKVKYKNEVTPEEIFYYIYSVLYSNTYRTKYAEFLKMDFPRIPFTDDYKTFNKLGQAGKQLADLHLLKSKELKNPIAKFPIEGSNKVEKLVYKALETENVPPQQSNCLFINKEQYFSGIPEEVWHYQIGGYQVCDKWLKDRKGKILTLEEITNYCKIVTALSRTIELQIEIDELYKLVE